MLYYDITVNKHFFVSNFDKNSNLRVNKIRALKIIIERKKGDEEEVKEERRASFHQFFPSLRTVCERKGRERETWKSWQGWIVESSNGHTRSYYKDTTGIA